MDIDVGQPGELGVPRVHPSDVAPERRLESAHVVRVVEVVVSPRVCAQGSVVALRRQGQRGAAPPPADQLGGEQLPLFLGTAMGPEEPIEGADPGLILAKAHIGAVAAEDLRLRHRQGNAGLTGISQDELAGLDQRSLAGQRLGAAALDRRLVDAVFVTQGIQVSGLKAEVLHPQNADARKTLVLFAGDLERAAPLFLGIAERAHPDVDLAGAERRIPILRIVDAFVAELPGASRHAHAERLGEALQRLLRQPERFQARIADSDRQPGIDRIPPMRGGADMRCEPAEELPACFSIVDAQEHVSAEVRCRPRPEDHRLDLIQVERRRGRRQQWCRRLP